VAHANQLLEVIASPGKHQHEINTDEFRVEGMPGQPDYGCLHIAIECDLRCIELKSLKLYLQSFAFEHMSYERVVETIWHDLYDVLMPHALYVEITFNPRGGLSSTVIKHEY